MDFPCVPSERKRRERRHGELLVTPSLTRSGDWASAVRLVIGDGEITFNIDNYMYYFLRITQDAKASSWCKGE